MAELKVLVEGYARKRENGWEASSTAVLVEDSGKRIIVDPGCNEELLLAGLRKEGLSPKDFDLVFLTHCHLDHLLNIRLFPGADVADAKNVYRGDGEVALSGLIPGTRVRIVPTPGHSADHAALAVGTDEGTVAVAGDLWWWKEGRQETDSKSLLELRDHVADDREALLKSRKKILSFADFVVPGHGRMFRVEK